MGSRRAAGAAVATAFLALLPGTAGAVVRHVSPIGSDFGACTSEVAACQSIGYAYAQSAPGDLVEVAAGEYGRQEIQGLMAPPGVLYDMDPGAHFTTVKVQATGVELRNG